MPRHDNHGLRKVCPCPRRRWAKCAHSWHLNFKIRGGRAYRLSLDREVGHHLATKAEAETEADRIRNEIRQSTFRAVAVSPSAPITAEAITFKKFGERFVDRVTKKRSVEALEAEQSGLRVIGAFTLPDGLTFDQKPIGAIIEDDIEVFSRHLQTLGRAASTRNHYLQLFHRMSHWAVKKGYLPRPWLSGDTDLKIERPAKRKRRLTTAEETALLGTASASLQRLILAALETGARRGELLSLQWADVDLPRREITFLASKTKDREHRTIPISSRLLAVLEMVRLDPAGEPQKPEAFVFGDRIGGQITSPKTAWRGACARAHITDLHFHDLRHEAASRRLEEGWPVHHVQELLGHADLKTTTVYLNVTRFGLHESMRKTNDLRAGCTPVASEPVTDPRSPCNEDSPTTDQVVVN